MKKLSILAIALMLTASSFATGTSSPQKKLFNLNELITAHSEIAMPVKGDDNNKKALKKKQRQLDAKEKTLKESAKLLKKEQRLLKKEKQLSKKEDQFNKKQKRYTRKAKKLQKQNK